MNSAIAPLTKRPAWSALLAHHKAIAPLHLRKLFTDDPARGERLALAAAGLYLDYSKNRITDETVELLVHLAEQSGLRERVDAMFRGDKINVSERPPCCMSRSGRCATPRSSSTVRTLCRRSMQFSIG
jgi:glucose-6-phosphate isomerase